MSEASATSSGYISRGTQTEDELGEIKADLKKLVETVQSLLPQPKPDDAERQFQADFELWGREIRPTPQKLEVYVDMLLSMFIINHNTTRELNTTRLPQGQWPSFANLLVLHVSDNWTVSPGTPSQGNVGLQSDARLREYIMLQRAQPYTFHNVSNIPNQQLPVNETTTRWKWGFPYDEFRVYHAHITTTQVSPWQAFGFPYEEFRDGPIRPVSRHGYGTLCLMLNTVKDGILSFQSINAILALIGRWGHKDDDTRSQDEKSTRSAIYFLGIFAGQWPSRNERPTFTLIQDSPSGQILDNPFNRHYLQLHFRCFKGIERPKAKLGAGGLQCDREQGRIGSYLLEERRISLFGLLSSTRFVYRHLARPPPAFYSVLILTDFHFDPDWSWEPECQDGLEGTAAFHAAVFTSVSLWQMKWNEVLDDIDNILGVRLQHTADPKERRRWIFDNNFERSELYVTILQVLRIFNDYIRTVSDDLRLLDSLFLNKDNFPMYNMSQDELRIMRANWNSVKKFQKETEQSLLGRVSRKTEEVQSLRDGLFNATSLREANRSTVIARYVLVFTIVTILYLPPGFISAVFDTDIFQKEVAQTKWEYKVALVSVSLTTYFAAFAFIVAVDWGSFKRNINNAKLNFRGMVKHLAIRIIWLLETVKHISNSGLGDLERIKRKCLHWWAFMRGERTVQEENNA
ncbi:hypothetical protein GGR51DRAFT_542117 [Nemania sp. FL0031]|nr:hypothetical protein GGR51DRAFT_542117 [Nemania sp. FL0031]